ncbi:hypothetical protein C7S20_00300 [Christiangramia fulva]|uniref:Glycosyltransferase 2-like domain-containing protein n=1 Tax=Christiangramia fulva TaxID=2126553 RepID=A0A2R3Z0Q1_9FLAO|nr:glycosyltransferase family 2 protein [Christiangramia fulva]AVR43835.1 hypothetical protein C7S20_00300 [Christiangramia fulva]
MDENSNNTPLVSIILPVYNGEKYLSQSIESCLDQSYTNLELIIVDDASTDNSLKIANIYASKDDRVKVIAHDRNKNLPASLNTGHRIAIGKYVTWTSHDNFYKKEAIEKMLASIYRSDADLVFSNFQIIDDKGNYIGSYSHFSGNTILLENIIRACFLYKVEVYERNNGYNENLFKIEDYAFWLMASLHSRFQHIPEQLYCYRSHSESLTAGAVLSQFHYKKEFSQKVKEMYQIYFAKLESNYPHDLAKLFKNLHLHQKIDLIKFFRSYKCYKKNLKKVFDIYGEKKVLSELDIRFRQNILRYPSNQTPRILFYILLKRHRLLFSYSKKKSFQIFFKSLMNWSH